MTSRALLDRLCESEDWDAKYPRAGRAVGSLIVRERVPNRASIEASLGSYTILPGVRAVPMSLFTGPGSNTPRAQDLARQITNSGEINPLIVVDDGHEDGPYVLEGANRFDALHLLKAPAFPALVVIERP